MQLAVEVLLIVLLAATLVHALRLERALGVLRRDRGALAELVAGFNASTGQAEQAIERLHAAAEGAGRQVARQAEAAASLRDDLAFLTERGQVLADRLDSLVRDGRAAAPDAARGVAPRAPDSSLRATPPARLRSQAERDLVQALRAASR